MKWWLRARFTLSEKFNMLFLLLSVVEHIYDFIFIIPFHLHYSSNNVLFIPLRYRKVNVGLVGHQRQWNQ